MKKIIILILLITSCFACKRRVIEPIKPNVPDNFSGTWITPYSTKLIVTTTSDTPDRITYNITNLKQVVLECFNDGNLVTSSGIYTGYSTNSGETLLFDNIQLGQDGQSYIKLNKAVNSSTIVFGGTTKNIHK
jgi:hypothetical protein